MYVEDDPHTDRPQAVRPIVPKPIVLKLTIREMYVEDEFLAVIYKNIDEGEITFDLTMSILEVDLPVAAPIRPT